jgi:hypothetical protein
MTHDELMAKVHSVFYEEEGGTQLDFKAANNQYRALQVVVSLHRPIGDVCLHCGEDTYYPCPTIKAIEKELINV